MSEAPAPAVPNFIYDRLTLLAACLCAQIREDGSPDTCFCGVIPGDGVAADYAGDCAEQCGMAWVRLMTSYPSTGVGVVDETPGNCGISIGLDIELGILRCMSIPEDGGPLPDGELAEVTRLQTADAMTLIRTVNCCDALPTKDVILGGYVPMGPLGGMVGGAVTVRTVL